MSECLLVGDNEQAEDLFLFTIEDSAIKPKSQKKLPLSDKAELSDIEALGVDADGKILAFGSHSRNTKCESDKKRRRFAVIELSGEEVKVSQQVPSEKITCKRLFGDRIENNVDLKAACDAITNAEAEAEKLEKKLDRGKLSKKEAKKRCNEISPFHAEGAVVIPSHGKTDVWIGLRAPLLAAHPAAPEHKSLAMLFRMKGQTAYEFDRVAFVDLEGRGIRELAFEGESVWVIAGPAADKTECFQLRRFSAAALSDYPIEYGLVWTPPAVWGWDTSLWWFDGHVASVDGD